MALMFAILRVLHIVSGILWAGGAVALGLFIAPTIGATGDVGKQFAAHLIGKTRFSAFMASVGGITVLAGAILYGIDSSWFQSGWMQTPTGIGFGIGAAAGILAFVFGMMLGNANKALAVLGAQIQGKPTAEQMSAIQALQKRQAMTGQWNMIFIFISIIMMGTARLLV